MATWASDAAESIPDILEDGRETQSEMFISRSRISVNNVIVSVLLLQYVALKLAPSGNAGWSISLQLGRSRIEGLIGLNMPQ
jgi:hypothetical protein